MTRRVKPKIVHLALDAVTPFAGNARVHSKRQIEALARSIAAHGWSSPIAVDADHVIIAGHGRYQAAQLLGLKEVPCVVRADLDDAQVRALRVVDNKIAELAGWDNDKLGVEATELHAMAVDLTKYGFSFGELEGLVAADVPAAALGDANTNKSISFNIEVGQSERILAAIALAKESEGVKDKGAALAAICEAYLAMRTKAAA